MLKTIARIDWGKVPYGVFITLTYPDDYYNRGYYERTIDRSRFIRDLEKYADKKIPILWRCEWQRRKTGKHRGLITPHFHMLCMGLRYVPHEDVRRWWRQALCCKGPLATDVRGIKGAEGCGRYLAKYLSKVRSLDNSAYLNKPWMNGRSWGLTRPDLVPFAKKDGDVELTDEEADEMAREYAEWRNMHIPYFNYGFTILGEKRITEFLERVSERS